MLAFILGTLMAFGACAALFWYANFMARWAMRMSGYLKEQLDSVQQTNQVLMGKLQQVAWTECAEYSRQREEQRLAYAMAAAQQGAPYNMGEAEEGTRSGTGVTAEAAQLIEEAAESGIPMDYLQDLYSRAESGEVTDTEIERLGGVMPDRLTAALGLDEVS
jgi:hypothetical protein